MRPLVAHTRGWPNRWDSDRRCWVYTDTGEPVSFSVPFGGADRPCPACDRLPSPEGHDACIADLPGVSFACCGHGQPDGHPYVQMLDGTYLKGEAALAFFAEHGRDVAA